MPPSDLFTPSFAPLPTTYSFHDHIKYPADLSGLAAKATTPIVPISPSRTPPRTPSDSGSESVSEEVKSAFVPIRLSSLPTTAATPSSSSPGRPVSTRKPTDGVKCELKAPTTLISKPSPTQTKVTSQTTSKPVWRPY
uniref:Uncharacterized protein n=1 Tax=Bracon brevicornis TaxID=1563983 RepID=A0A6V7KTI7_9HYME